MHQVKIASARQLADNLKRTHKALDSALIEMTMLTTNMLEVGTETGMAAAEGQKALEAVTQGISTIVTGRNRMVRAHRQMAALKDRSNLKVVDMGCLPGPLTTGRLSAV